MAGCDGRLRAGLTVSLYLHVPFCAAKCAYCEFTSYPDLPQAQVREVLGETLRQLEHFAALLAPPATPSVYVGGGTPSLLEPRQMAALLRGARAFGGAQAPAAGQGPELTVEANPESLLEEWLAACRAGGVNRLSLGVQSLQDPLLQALGRRATAAQARAALRLLDRSWPLGRSVDLLAGIPGQTTKDLEQDIREVCAGPCGHVSLYTLTVPSGSALRVDPDEADRLWLAGRRLLERLGYEQYEVSNFARPGEQCQHNLRYWRLEPYLGVGPAAVGTLPSRDGAPLRLTNPAALERYLAGEAEGWGMQSEEIAPRDFLLENLMMGLRLREGIRAEVFTQRFGRGLPELLPQLWQSWRSRRLLRPPGGRPRGEESYALTDAARLRLNPLLVEASAAIESVDPRLPVRWP